MKIIKIIIIYIDIFGEKEEEEFWSEKNFVIIEDYDKLLIEKDKEQVMNKIIKIHKNLGFKHN